MAKKKPRTPKPPRPAGSGGQRPVQAPQRRTGPSRTARTSAGPSTSYWARNFWPLLAGISGFVILGIVLGIILTRTGPKLALTHPISWKDLPGLQTGKPPWPANASLLDARISNIGLAPLGQEQLAFHIHQHLDIYVDGKKVTVPRYVGIQINAAAQTASFAELHTHRPDGVIHDESARNVKFTLQQFFGDWGVRLTNRCLGSFKGSCDNLHAWVNGKPITNPANLVLKSHQEIVLSVGTPPKTIPAKYNFPAGE